MEVELFELQEIAAEYDFPLQRIMGYYSMIRNYPCVMAKDDQSLIDCLHLIVQDRISEQFLLSRRNEYESLSEYKEWHYKSEEESISDALYRIYEDAAIPNLTEEFKHKKRIRSFDE